MATPGNLVIRYDDLGDGTARLSVKASSNGFSGEGSAWIGENELGDFAEAIGEYPILENKQPMLAGGFYRKVSTGEIGDELLYLGVFPIDRKGHLGIQVRIATEPIQISGQDRPPSQHTVRLEIITSYEPLATFSRDLRSLAQGRISEAVLDGDVAP